ncbi:MAG: hypothetical protein F4X64_13405 [Chloroflexi bacterium]|nr:hypothetical protein [Chloroflexota bacterium]
MEDEPVRPGGDVGASGQAESSLPDDLLPDPADALVDAWSGVLTAQVLAVDNRTLANCCDTRRTRWAAQSVNSWRAWATARRNEAMSSWPGGWRGWMIRRACPVVQLLVTIAPGW